MTLVTRVAGGKAAVYEKPVSGDPLAPFGDPGAHLDLVFFHSDLDFYRVHSGPTDVTVTLPTVAAASHTVPANPSLIVRGQVQIDDLLLVTHDLGYVPNYFIISNNGELISGDMVQQVDDANGYRGRYLGHWADTSGVYLRSFGVSSAANLNSMSFDCTVVVFAEGAPSGDVVIDFDTITGRLTMGKGMFDSDQVLLRAQGQAGDSPYDIQLGQSIDIDDGRSRVARANGTITDEPGYGGSFVAPASFQGVIA